MPPAPPGLECAVPGPIDFSAVVMVEAGGLPFAVHVNHAAGKPEVAPVHPTNAEEAVQIAQHYIGLGYTVDLGPGQVNSANLPDFAMSAREALTDPCANVRVGSTILAANWRAAVKRYGYGPQAIMAALSAYNTGSFERGFLNGYVARYVNPGESAFRQVPANSGVSWRVPPRSDGTRQQSPRAATPDPYTADTAVYTAGAQISVPIE